MVCQKILYNSIAIVQVRKKMDLIIGNPPWLVLNGIYSNLYKENIKKLANSLDIKPRASNITQLEMSALFLYQTKDIYLRDGGKIGLVVSNAFTMGSQHNGTRKFKDLRDIHIWKFTKDVFNIHNICLIAEKEIGSQEKNRLSVIVDLWDVEKNKSGYSFNLHSSETYTPVDVLRDNNGKLIGVEKLISSTDRTKLLPRSPEGDNHYFPQCYVGASLYPRPLIFVNVIKKENNTVTIEPNTSFMAKSPWDFRPFVKADVEEEYIHSVVKSTEFVSFLILDKFNSFLPLNKSNFITFNGDPVNLNPLAKKHFANLKNIYLTKQKEDSSIKDLWVRINYQRNLGTARQIAPLKLVTNMVGGFVKGAIVRGEEIIVDYSLYIVPLFDEDEAFYLLGIFNSYCISMDVKIRSAEGAEGGVRNIMKRPWEINIPKYNAENPLHQKLVSKAKDMERRVMDISINWRQKEFQKEKKKKKISVKSVLNIKWKPRTIQNIIFKELSNDLLLLDKLCLKLLKSEGGLKPSKCQSSSSAEIIKK